MQTRFILLLMAPFIAAGLGARAAQPPSGVATTARLHNGWRLTPAGAHEKVGDTLLGGVLSPDGKRFALTNAGYGAHHLYLVNALSGKVEQTLPLARAWNGIAWSPDSATLYVSGGGSPRIHVLTRGTDGLFTPTTPLRFDDLGAVPPEEKGGAVDKS
jgi:sugar lactone lactonase YvrE